MCGGIVVWYLDVAVYNTRWTVLILSLSPPLLNLPYKQMDCKAMQCNIVCLVCVLVKGDVMCVCVCVCACGCVHVNVCVDLCVWMFLYRGLRLRGGSAGDAVTI